MYVTLDKFGRVLIPKPVRERLGLVPGTSLKLEIGEQDILLRARRSESSLVEEDGLLVCTAEWTGSATNLDTVALIEASRRDRTEKLVQLAQHPSELL